MDEKIGVQVNVGTPMTWTQAMRLAVHEGKKGAGCVAPNPLVGCVILDSQMRFLASGYHRAYGLAHAEVEALQNVEDSTSLKGAHLVVTLEPCAHEGKTPSCAKRLAQLPLASVVYGLEDPNPLVAGQGAKILREAGISTSSWLEHKASWAEGHAPAVYVEIEELAEVFLHGFRHQMPFVALKVATSLDGKMALQSGESKWITGETAREYSHMLRAQYDAVLVGRNTFVADNPSLNVRHSNFPNHKNKVILFDSGGRSLTDLAGSRILQVRPPENVLVVVNAHPPTGPRTLEVCRELANTLGVQLLEIPSHRDEGFDLKVLLNNLWQRQVRSVFIEGGAHVFGSFLRAGCVQRLHVFMAPCLIGGRHGRSWTEFFGESEINRRLLIRHRRNQTLGDDIYFTGRLDNLEYPSKPS